MPSRRRRYRRRPKTQVKRPPANEEIKAVEVRLVGIDGAQLGVVSIEEARTKAEESNADLVTVAQKSDPPVVRIMDLGKHMYEQRKKQAKQKAKSKGGEIKGVRISFKISDHDRNIRLRRADDFLEEGHKVKLEMRLRGREKGRVNMAIEKLTAFIGDIASGAKLEGNVSRAPNNISAVIIRDTRARKSDNTDQDEEADNE